MPFREFSFQNPFERSAFLHRLQSAYEPLKLARIEGRLALLRLAPALAFFLILWIFPADSSPSRRVWILGYLAFSAAIVSLRWIRPTSDQRLGAVIHVVDVGFVAAGAALPGQPLLIFHALFFFVLFASAYRWGFVETLVTALGMAVITPIAKDLALPAAAPLLPAWKGIFADFVIPTSVLGAQGVVVGFLAGEVKRHRIENDIIHRAMAGFNSGGNLTGSLEGLCSQLHKIFGVGTVLIAAREKESEASFLWRGLPDEEGDFLVDLTDLDPDLADAYFFDAPAQTWCGVHSGEMQGTGFRCHWPMHAHWTLRRGLVALPRTLLDRHPVESMLVHTEAWGRRLTVRYFLLGPVPAVRGASGLLFLQQLASRTTPALISSYVARRMSAQAAKVERESLARDLHDGVIQSLIAIEMQMAALVRGPLARSSGLAERLAGIQEYLHNEIRNMRNLMQRLKHLELGSAEFLQALESVALQHQCETNIATEFESDVRAVLLPPRTCGEVVRILQEALVNVRKHSAAAEVRIRFEEGDGGYNLTVSDNGSGFDFTGRLNLDQLDSMGKGPKILKERVRLVGGSLELESNPGKGSFLFITIPRRQYGAH